MENLVTAEELKAYTTGLIITNDDESEKAYNFAKEIASAEKEIKARYKEPKAEAQKAHKAIVAKEKDELKPFENAKKIIKSAIGKYESKKAAERLEEQKKREEVAKIMGTDVVVEEQEEVKKHTRKVWKAKVTDAKAIPDDLKNQIINMYAQQFFNDYVKIYHDANKVTGVEFYAEETVVLR